jgi:hypothetical protein
MPQKGLFSFTYYSGDGKDMNGCKPIVSFRKALLQFVLINEEEIIPEELHGKLKDKNQLLKGEKCFERFHTFWEGYLIQSMNTSTTSTNKKK